MCKYTHMCADTYTCVNIHVCMYTHICTHAYTYTHNEIFPFRFMGEKSITCGQLCKTFEFLKLFFQEPKNHISKYATNCKMVTTSGGAYDIVFLIHPCPQIDHKTPAG